MTLQKKLKGEWVVLYGIEASAPYVIDEGMIATYGFFPPQTTRDKQLGQGGRNVLQNGESEFILQGLYSMEIIIGR